MTNFSESRFSASITKVKASRQESLRLNIETISAKLDLVSTSNSKSKRCLKSRHIVVILGFLVFFILNAHRLNISIAIVAMVNTTATGAKSDAVNSTDAVEKWSSNNVTSERKKFEGELNWSPKIQGYILGAAYVGYIATQAPGGRLADLFGAKLILVLGLLISSVCNLMTPWASRLSAYAIITVQLVKGLGQGTLQPAISCLIADWFPSSERGFLFSIMFSGIPVGAFVAGYASGELCATNFLGGWPSSFYIFGGLGCISCIALMLFLYNTPYSDPTITATELKYITGNQDNDVTEKKQVLPWTVMLTSVPVWAVVAAMFGQYWMAYYFLSVHPTYMGSILHFPIQQNGVLSSAPYILQALVACFASYLSDWLKSRNYVSMNFIRKANNTASCIGFSLSLLGVYFAGSNKVLNIVLFVTAMGCIGFGIPGSLIAPVDMSPTFAGTLTGISCTLASLSGLIVPIVVGVLTNEQQTLAQWRKVFLTSIAVALGSAIIFLFFGSAEVQKWDPTATKMQVPSVQTISSSDMKQRSTEENEFTPPEHEAYV